MSEANPVTEQPVWKSGVTLAVIATVCTALVAGTWQLTRDRIEENRKEFLERSLTPALAGLFFDNSVTESMITIPPPHELPGSGPALVYRVYADETPVAALFVVTARDGYSGPIRLLIGIAMNGEITGVRVLEHRETPGLGDRVEIEKTDWVLQFDGRSLSDPTPDRWSIKGDGGEFDQLSGASVTPRSIVKAVKTTLNYFESNSVAIFAAAPDSVEEPE